MPQSRACCRSMEAIAGPRPMPGAGIAAEMEADTLRGVRRGAAEMVPTPMSEPAREGRLEGPTRLMKWEPATAAAAPTASPSRARRTGADEVG